MQWINFEHSLNQRLNGEQLDFEQNRARNFSITGHSLVRGVAGSGKSLVLRNRVERIIEAQLNPVLVLCYNRFMKGWIQSTLRSRNLRVDCTTFHQWSYRRLGYDYKYDRNDDLRQRVIALARNSGLRYQAILVDEAQDFYDEWFQALLEILNPNTNSLFFVYDNTQSVYGQRHRRKSGWTWINLGIRVQRRSQIFDLNYRNTPEILELAWKFIQPALNRADIRFDRRENNPTIDKIIEPRKRLSRSSGISPLLIKVNYNNVAFQIANQIRMALMTCTGSSIGILIHPTHSKSKQLKQEISRELNKLGIEHHAPARSENRNGNVVDRPYVIVDSWNALKGVEFDAVIAVGVDLSAESINIDLDFEEKAGLYVAMTRARDHLVMLYQDKTPMVELIENALNSSNILRSDGGN